MIRTDNGIDYTTKTLLKFSEKPEDSWTVDDAIKGISIMGGTGSGKTTASGKTLAKIFLKEGWGGLVLCAKTEEAQLWKTYCEEAGRENDLIIFGKGARHENGEYKGEEIIFNPIDYEMKRSGEGAGEAQNITNIFMNIYRMGNRIASEGDTKEERYWDTALKRCLNRVIELIKLAGEDLTYSNMVRVISSSGNMEKDTLTDAVIEIEREGELAATESGRNYCLKCLLNAYFNTANDDTLSSEKRNAFNLVEDYFTQAMPSMGSRTKSVVTESFMGLAEPFLSGLLYKHFGGKTNIFPEWTYQKNKIIVLDFPIKEYLDAGIIGQCAFKLLFQQSIERRNIKDHPNPVFLWCDEAQYFVNPYDQIFLTTARSSRTATVFLSQNISNYFAVMGSGSDAKARVDSLMGNLCTKIFHANSDAVTNEYSSKLIGSDIIPMESGGTQYTSFSLKDSKNLGYSMQLVPQVLAKEFTLLRSGGQSNEFKVDAIVMVSGKKWSDGRNFKQTVFKQNFNS
jgi:hypothetical protein